MSIHVTDPSGTTWTVTREWLGLPTWTRRNRGRLLPDPPPITTIGDDASGYGGLALIVLAFLLVVVLLWLLVPLFVFVAGVMTAAAALLARLLGLSSWTVRARRSDSALTWRVRGLGRSRRALHEVAESLAVGHEPTVDGVVGEAE